MDQGLTVFVPGTPRPQPRPRVTKSGVYSSASKTKAWKQTIALFCAKLPKMSGPVTVLLGFQLPRPPSHWKHNKTLRRGKPEHHLQVPDVDNLAKAVLDALKGLAWEDDSQVVRLYCSKRWADYGQEGCYVTIGNGQLDVAAHEP